MAKLVLRLHAQGLSGRAIARSQGMSRRSVSDVLDAARAVGVSTTAAARGAMTTVSLGTEWADDLSVEADDDPMGCGTDFLALLHPTHAHILAARHGIGRPMRTLVQLATACADRVELTGLGRTLPDGHAHEPLWDEVNVDRRMRIVFQR